MADSDSYLTAAVGLLGGVLVGLFIAGVVVSARLAGADEDAANTLRIVLIAVAALGYVLFTRWLRR